MTVRSIWWAASIPGASAPFDTAHLRIFYPAIFSGTDEERLSGVFAADATQAPYPVALIVSGVNVGQEAYRWLAVELASRGYIAVTYDWVGELFGGLKGITPGVTLDAAKPDSYGSGPTTPSVPAVLDALASMTGPLENLIDLDKVGLIGHSAGGTVILQSARFFPAVKAVAAYGTHTMVATMLGWPAGTVLPAQVDSPVLLMAGENDGVINGSADRYGSPEQHSPITRTFDEALPDRDGANLHVTFAGANHFGIVHPVDETAARAFLDQPATTDPEVTRAALADLLAAFLDLHLRGLDGAALDKALQSPDIAAIRRR
ncbi:dienelactone hydrolase family protein [Actinoplanes sp. NPDC051851]|uniref:dienelactone hydrolase family protein n=1 Tax=Actinoplanes sp. NPDC051851 TaxID=3154753 RepID=UPI003415FB14